MTRRTAAGAGVVIVAIGWSIAMTLVAASRSAAAPGTLTPDGGFDSPRMAALARDLSGGDQGALDRFYAELNGKAPLVEPTANDPRAAWVTFIWRADANARTVSVQGGPATGDYAARMSRLGTTDLWYRTDLVPSDARFTYFFQVNRPVKFPAHAERLPPIAPPRADPMNPRRLAGPERSLAELPDAPPQPWLTPVAGAGKGVVKEHALRSEMLAGAWTGVQQQRRFAVYTPPSYDPRGEACDMLVMFDGAGYADSNLPTPAILDWLLAQRKIRPTVAVFVFQTADRDREVGCSPHFADFVAKELTPWVRTNYRVSDDPQRMIVGGMSGGGVMAAYCALRHSATFGNVLSLSGAFGFWPGSLEEKPDDEPGWLTREFVKLDRVPVRFHLAAGRFENWFFPYSLLAENRRFRDVLRAKGYAVEYHEFSGAHDPICWRGPLADGLTALAGERK